MGNRRDDRYFATPDPDNPQVMTYWREHADRHGRRFSPWPHKTAGLPRLLRSDLPKDAAGKQRVMAEHITYVRGWLARAREAIEADRVAAGRLFAEWQMRCCICARALTDQKSKTVGIGPECRAGISAEHLAAYMTPRVGRIHAAAVSGPPLEQDEVVVRTRELWAPSIPSVPATLF